MMGVQKHILRNYVISIAAALCTIQHGYDTALFSSVQIIPAWKAYFNNPSPPIVGAVTTGFNVGAVVFGYLVSSSVSDYLGRKASLFIGSALVLIGAFVMTFSPTIGGFIAGRTIVGSGLGVSIPAGPVYIEELVYARIRGRLMTFWQMFFGVGQLLASFIAYGCTYKPSLGEWQWRIVTLLQIFPPILLCSCLLFCPETPRWYLQKGKVEKARKVLMTIRTPEEAELEILEIREAVRYEQEVTKGRFKQLLVNKSYRKRLILAVTMNFGQQMSGLNSLATYGGLIYNEVFGSSKTALLVTGITSTLLIVYCLTCFFLVDRWGRRPLLMVGAVGQALMMMGIALLVTETPLVNGKHPYGVGIGVAALGATVWIWTSEVFPLVVRANGVAIGSQTQQLGGVILGQAFPSFLARCGFYTFYFFMGINVLLGFFVYFFIPETKGASLEHIDSIFGAVDHVAGGAKVLGIPEVENPHPTEETSMESAPKLQ